MSAVQISHPWLRQKTQALPRRIVGGLGPFPRGQALDDGGARASQGHALEGGDLKARVEGRAQLAWRKREIWVARPLESFVTDRECLVNQAIARRHRRLRGTKSPPLFEYVTGRLIKGSPEMLSNESLAASDQSSPNSPYRAIQPKSGRHWSSPSRGPQAHFEACLHESIKISLETLDGKHDKSS